MVPEPTKPSHSSSSDGDKHKQLDREVRDMVNAITSRVGDLHKTGGSQQLQQAEQDENGVRIITLAGTNTGATMRTELDEKVPNNAPQGGVSAGEPDLLDTYVNSNFQAVNNSIMLGSSYNTNDPGVHLDIADVFDHRGHKPNKHAKKGKKKDKEALKSDQQTERSD